MNRMRKVLVLFILLSSLIQKSTAGCVWEGGLYVIDGVVLYLLDAVKKDFLF